MRDGASLYAVDAELIEELQPDVIVTQDLCAVCAVSSGELASACPVERRGALARSAHARRGRGLGPTARRRGSASRERGEEVASRMEATIEKAAATVRGRPRRRVFFAEWLEPPFCAGHWLPEMIELAGGVDVLGRAGRAVAHDDLGRGRSRRAGAASSLGPCGFDAEEAAAAAGELELAARGRRSTATPTTRGRRRASRTACASSPTCSTPRRHPIRDCRPSSSPLRTVRR